MSRLKRDEASEEIRADKDTSPEALEDASDESAVERDTSPEARDDASLLMEVDNDVSAETEPICCTLPSTIMYTLLLYTHMAPLETSPSASCESSTPKNNLPFAWRLWMDKFAIYYFFLLLIM